jgi:hypothetical protein
VKTKGQEVVDKEKEEKKKKKKAFIFLLHPVPKRGS